MMKCLVHVSADVVRRLSRSKCFARSGILVLLLLVVSAWPVGGARAQGDVNQTAMTIMGPIDNTNCSAIAPTITVLGQTIDVSGAFIGADDGAGCTALVVGDTAVVALASSSAPLVATAVGRPPCPILVPFCPAQCRLDQACPAKCHCPAGTCP